MIETIEAIGADGVPASARVAGDSGPALMFVHGVGSTAAIWDSQLAAFSDRFRCAAVELRGNGARKPDPDPASITRAGFALDVLAVADARGFDRFATIGCSLGGVVAFELWTRVPERMTAIVFADSFARYPDAAAYVEGIAAAVRAAGDMQAFGAQRAAKLGLPPDRLEVTIAQMACKSVSSYLASTQATWTGDYRPVLGSIDVPVLAACGDRDTLTPAALSHEIVAGIAGARYAGIPGAGHVSNADNPAAFNALLAAFLGDAGVER